MTLAWLIGLILAVAASGFFSGSETGLYCVNRLRIRVDAEHLDRAASRIAPLIAQAPVTLAVLLIGTTLANYVATICAANLVVYWGVERARSELYTTIMVTPILFVFGEVVPKIVYQRNPDQLMRGGSLLLAACDTALRWPALALNAAANVAVRLAGPTPQHEAHDPRRNMALLLQEAIATEDESGEHSEFVQRVLRLSTVPLHQVMVPRNRVISISATADRRELIAHMRKYPHTRFIVQAASARRVLGYVVGHQLLADSGWSVVADRTRPIVTLSANESVAAAILRLKAAHETLAIVTDRHDSLLGLVTRKDLFEELTGELYAW